MSVPVRHLPVVGDAAPDLQRPRTRGNCIGGPRPCPWVSCEHHLLLGHVDGRATHKGDSTDESLLALLDSMPDTCALDVADRGGATLEEIAQTFVVTRERVRQIEAKALGHLPRRVKHLHEMIVEDPDLELRPARCGPVPASEQRTWTSAPAQHAHLPGPADVADGEGQMWCGHMGVALRAKLCVQRHTARCKGSAMSGAAGRSYPTYPDCARCPDGASVAARIGAEQLAAPSQVDAPTAAAPELPTAPTSAPIDWFGDAEGGVPANDCDSNDAPAAMGAEEDDVKAAKTVKATKAAVKVTSPGAGCDFPGCAAPRAGFREALDAALRPFCIRHRTRAQSIRSTKQIGSSEAVALLLAGAGKQHATRSEIAAGARAEAPAPQDHDDLRARVEAGAAREADLRSQIASLRAELAAVRTAAPVDASPWPRLTRLAAALHEGEVWWSVDGYRGPEVQGAGYSATAHDCDTDAQGQHPLWAGYGATPDEALTALVAAVEAEGAALVARAVAIRAALEGP